MEVSDDPSIHLEKQTSALQENGTPSTNLSGTTVGIPSEPFEDGTSGDLHTDTYAFIPSEVTEQLQHDAIHSELRNAMDKPDNKDLETQDILDWPAIGMPINEYTTEALAAKWFPTRKVTLTEAAKHHENFCEVNAKTGCLTWRFASHRHFPGWINDIKRRHALTRQGNIFIQQNPDESPATIQELIRKLENAADAKLWLNKLKRYVANIPGTNPFWSREKERLQAMAETLGPGHLFYSYVYGR